MTSDNKTSVETTTENVWFVDVITHYGPRCAHSVPVHVSLERCTEVINAKYLAIVDQNCPVFRGTEKWLRVLHNSWGRTFHDLAELAKQGHYRIALTELKTKLISVCELWIRIRSLLKTINNNATRIVVYLDFANPVQILAVWLSISSLRAIKSKTIVWTHFHRDITIGRFARCVFRNFPIKAWRTAYTSEIAAENKKYDWVVDILPIPLNPALNTPACNDKMTNRISEKLVCWCVMTRPEQGLDMLPNIIYHKSARAFPQQFIKCFVRKSANIGEKSGIELVSLPYLSDEDYYSYFNECDVVLIPYNAQSFGGMSMVFMEAIATGKIPIVSDGTVMARELKRFKLGDLVMDFKNEFSWTLVNQIRQDPSIRARLNLMAESYVTEHDTFACAQSLYQGLKKVDLKMPLNEPKRS